MLKKYVKLIIAILFVSNVMAQNIPSYVPTNGLQGWWPFSGNSNDESGNGNNGNVTGATLTTDRSGKANSAYNFATNQEITIANSATKNTYPLTISVWYNTSDVGAANGNIFSKYTVASWNGFGLFHMDQNAVQAKTYKVTPFYLRSTTNRIIGEYNEPIWEHNKANYGTWYNLTVTYDNTGGKIYLDGNLISSHNWTGTAGASANSNLWKIGGKWDQWFNGKIDDIGVWNRVLTDVEIKQLYTSTGSSCTTAQPIVSNAQSFCTQATVAELKASGTDIKWYSTSSGGTPLTSTTSLKSGSVYYASQTLNNCESPTRAAVTVTIIPKPFVYTSDFMRCDAGIADLKASSSTGGTINWYASKGGIIINTGNTYSVNLDKTTTYYVQVVNGLCFSDFNVSTANINPTPVILGLKDTSICDYNSVKLTTKATSGTINWYNTITGGTKLTSGETYTTPTLYNTTTFYVEATNGQCTTKSRLPINVNVNIYRIEYTDTLLCAGSSTKLTVSSNNTSNITDYKIGSTGPAGGIVFYDQGSVINGWRYLEVTPKDVVSSNANTSGCYCTTINNTSASIGAGSTNTKEWENAGCPTAAKGYTLNGFSDWFVPSKDELNQMYLNLKTQNIGGFANLQYWSSTPDAYGSCGINGGVAVQNFTDGKQLSEYRNGYQGSGNLRLIRGFASNPTVSTYLWSTGETTQSINPKITKATDFWVDITTNGVTCRKYISINVYPTLKGDLTMGNNNQTKCVNQPIENIEYTFNNLYYYPVSLGTISKMPAISNVNIKGNKLYINGTPNTSGTYNYSISVKGVCETTDVKGVLVINSLPNASIYTNGPSEVCEGKSVNLIAKGGVNYKWSNGLITDNITVKESGKFDVTVSDANGCVANASQVVTIFPNPIVSMNDLSPLLLKSNAPIKLYGKPTGGTFSGQGVNGAEFNPSMTTLGKKVITYNYTSPQGCAGSMRTSTIVVDSVNSVCSTYDTLKIKVQLTTGIKAGQQTYLNVYPNPTSDVLIIESNDIQALVGYRYKILDIQGKEVYNALATNAKTEISLKSIGAKGMYILHIEDEKGVSIENKKIVLE